MSFYARNFVFDDVPSEIYGLIISSSDGGDSSSSASMDVELKTQSVFRRPAPYLYGVSQSPVLEFEAEITSIQGDFTAIDSSLIQKWLFGHTNYKKLKIVQPDMEDIYFNCFLKDPKIKRVGNLIVGYIFTVVCDSPYAWGMTKTVTYTQPNRTYILYNESENNFYTYPNFTILMDGGTPFFKITNVTDNNRVFHLQNLSVGETITVNNDLQIITATLTPNILSKFVSPIQFFRLLPGANELFLEGNFVTLDISYKTMRKGG